MSKVAVLNTLTRLILAVVLVLFLLVGGNLWLSVLVAGLVTIALLYFFNVKGRQGFVDKFRPSYQEYNRVPEHSKIRTGLIGTETKKVPRSSVARLDGVEPTIIFRKK